MARVAVNLRGVPRDAARPGRRAAHPRAGSSRTDLVDVRLAGDPVGELPADADLHVGSAAVPARVRPLGADTARLRLARPLPLRVGDRALLRDPGRHHVAGGVTVLDVAPPPLRPPGRGRGPRRGARRPGRPSRRAPASCAAAAWSGAAELDRDGGAGDRPAPVAGDWLRRPRALAALRRPAGRRGRPARPGAPAGAGRAGGGAAPARSACPTGRWSRRWSGRRCALRGGRVGPASAAARCPSRWPGPCERVRAELGDRAVRGARGGPARRARARARGRSARPCGPARCSGWPTTSCCCPTRSTSAVAGAGRGCRSRSPSARPGRRWTPPAGSRCRCWSCWTGAGVTRRLPDDARVVVGRTV